jgi:hypothetical protein
LYVAFFLLSFLTNSSISSYVDRHYSLKHHGSRYFQLSLCISAGTTDKIPLFLLVRGFPFQVMAHNVNAVDVEDLLLDLDIFGGFAIYRDTSRMPPMEDCVFLTFGVAFMPEYGYVQHNTFSMVKVEQLHIAHPAASRWLAYNHWVTTNPSPWLHPSPSTLVAAGELFPSIIQMVEAVSSLRVYVDYDDPPPKREK